MIHRPSFDEFAALAAAHTVVPVYRQMIGDALTPVSAFRKIERGDRDRKSTRLNSSHRT